MPLSATKTGPGANRTPTAAPVKGSGFSMPELIVSTKGGALNRLAPYNAAPRTNKMKHLLEHLDDAGGDRADEAKTIRAWLANPSFGDKTIADIVTKEICKPDNLGWAVGPTAVRNYRDQMEN